MTISDVAHRAGVSISTVSRVINDSGYPVSTVVRERVQTAVDELHFAPSVAAQGLRQSFTNVIGLIVRDISDHHFGEIARGVTERAMGLGCLCFVCNTGRKPESELQYHELLWKHRVQGIILSGGGIDTPEYAGVLSRQLKRREQFGLRLVGIGPQDMDLPSVSVDYALTAASMTRYLISRGHRAIAFVTGSRYVLTSRNHLQGYRTELRSHRIPVRETMTECRDFTEEGGYQGCRALLSHREPFTAICAGSDTIAIGAVHALKEAGLRVPEDVSLIGIGDIPPARYLAPPLSTIRVPRYAMGALAVEMITGEVPVSQNPILLSTELVERSSVRSL